MPRCLVALDFGERARVALHHKVDLVRLLGGDDARLLELRQQFVHFPLASALGRLEDLGVLAADDGARHLTLRERQGQQPHDHAARVLLGALGDRSGVLGLGKGLLEGLDGERVVTCVERSLGWSHQAIYLLHMRR